MTENELIEKILIDIVNNQRRNGINTNGRNIQEILQKHLAGRENLPDNQFERGRQIGYKEGWRDSKKSI